MDSKTMLYQGVQGSDQHIYESASLVLARHLGLLRHPDQGIIRLVQFSHDSPGLRHYKHRIAESLIQTLISEGFTLTKAEPDSPLESE